MKREELTALGLTEEQINEVMRMNGTDINALRTARDNLQSDLNTANGKLAGYDPDWQNKLTTAQNDLTNLRRDHAIDLALAEARVRNGKAARAMLELDKITFSDDGKLEGLSDQMTALQKDSPWLFRQGAAVDTGGEHGKGGSAGADGVEAAFAALNPGLKL